MHDFEWNLPTRIAYGPEQLAMHIRFPDVGIRSEKFERMADDIVRMYGGEDGKVPGPRPVGRSDILEIVRRSL